MNLIKKISNKFSNLKIQAQLILLVSLGSFVISAFFYFYTINKQNSIYNEYFEKNASTLSESIKIAVELGASNEQYEALIPVFQWAQRDSAVKFIALLDEANELIVNFPLDAKLNIPDLINKSKNASIDDPIYVKKVEWKAKIGNGHALIGFSTSKLISLREETFSSLSISTLLLLIISLTLFSGISYSITKPLNKLISVASEISKGNQEKRADNTIGNIELKTLANAFNKMLDKIIETQELRLQEVQEFTASLEKQNIKLIELHNDKNEFFGIVAHDLKNPLSSILLNADLIISYFEKMQKQDILDYLNKISQTAKSMNILIRDLLDTNALESGNISIEPSNINLRELINEISIPHKTKASIKRINFNLECNDDLIIYVDSFRLSQILDNLISNAIKFSPSDTQITVKSFSKENKALILIKDEGPGISKDEIHLLFHKFTRLSAKPTGNESSTGLGLSIAKKLTENMGGKIWCESEVNQGAEFYIEFPLV